jgi:hypothetical protein
MSIPQSIMTFREKRASELELVARALDKNASGKINSYPIREAVKQLKNPHYIPTLKNGTRDNTNWGYEIEGFTIPVETLKHIQPQGLEKPMKLTTLGRIKVTILAD